MHVTLAAVHKTLLTSQRRSNRDRQGWDIREVDNWHFNRHYLQVCAWFKMWRSRLSPRDWANF